jgi:hypothetical protein
VVNNILATSLEFGNSIVADLIAKLPKNGTTWLEETQKKIKCPSRTKQQVIVPNFDTDKTYVVGVACLNGLNEYEGPYQVYDEDNFGCGIVMTAGQYKSGRKDGKWVTTDGQEFNFKDGKKHGFVFEKEDTCGVGVGSYSEKKGFFEEDSPCGVHSFVEFDSNGETELESHPACKEFVKESLAFEQSMKSKGK